jgi:hypothetical protein
VVLRGLTLKGTGTGTAVTLTAADMLSIEDTTIDRWAVGLRLNNGVAASVAVSNSVFRGNGTGVTDSGGSGGNHVSVEETRFEFNSKGIEVLSSRFMVRESVFVGNTGTGVVAGPGGISIQRSEFSLNATGLSSLSGGVVRIGRSRVFGNGIGLSAAGGSTFLSTGTNVVRANGVNTNGTISITGEQ